MTTRTLELPTAPAVAADRTFLDVVKDVAVWQADLAAGRDPGPVPLDETGVPLARWVARRFFGWEVPNPRSCAVAA